jgi:hypothetical protein
MVAPAPLYGTEVAQAAVAVSNPPVGSTKTV